MVYECPLSQIISLLCDHLSSFYIHEVILVNEFNQNGCNQIKMDVEKGIKAIFSQHILVENEDYFQLKDVIDLLTMKQANAILLLESLQENESAKDVLNDVNLVHLEKDQALKILRRRIDMK